MNHLHVDIVVRTGDTNIARAGNGPRAKIASSTSSAYEAAVCAAAKYLKCHRRFLVVAFEGEIVGGKTRGVNFRATRHAKPVKYLTLEFEDKGQDFLTWEVELATGRIVDCHPFQYTTWARCCVIDPEKLAPGSRPQIADADGTRRTLNYAVATMRLKGTV